MKLAPRERRVRPDYLIDNADTLNLGKIFLGWKANTNKSHVRKSASSVAPKKTPAVASKNRAAVKPAPRRKMVALKKRVPKKAAPPAPKQALAKKAAPKPKSKVTTAKVAGKGRSAATSSAIMPLVCLMNGENLRIPALLTDTIAILQDRIILSRGTGPEMLLVYDCKPLTNLNATLADEKINSASKLFCFPAQ